MSTKVSIDGLAESVMKELNDYKDLSTEDMKKDVRKVANNVKKEIKANAPRKTGKYAASWATKTAKENNEMLSIVVYSKLPSRPHLLENGHALRRGGRARAFPHIAPAEEHGAEELERLIERDLRKNG